MAVYAALFYIIIRIGRNIKKSLRFFKYDNGTNLGRLMERPSIFCELKWFQLLIYIFK